MLGACSQSKVQEQKTIDSTHYNTYAANSGSDSTTTDSKKKQLVESILNMPDVIRFARFETIKKRYGSIFIYFEPASVDIDFPVTQAGYPLQVVNNTIPEKPCYVFKIIDYNESAAKVMLKLDMTGLMVSGQLIYIDGRWIPDKNFIVGVR